MSSKVPGSAHLNLSLGALVLLGGTYGYVRRGSKLSLLAGVTMGSLLMGSSYLISKTDRIYEGHVLASGTAAVMALAMGQRYMQTAKFMPAGLVAILGATALAYNVHKAREWAPSPPTKTA